MAADNMYVCPKCKAVFRRPHNKQQFCPDCNVIMIDTGFDSESWYSLKPVDRRALIEKAGNARIVYKPAPVEPEMKLLCTTGLTFEGYNIIAYLGIESGNVVIGTGFLSEFGAGLSDFFGKQSELFNDKIDTAKQAALKKLRKRCFKMGANAIIGIQLLIYN